MLEMTPTERRVKLLDELFHENEERKREMDIIRCARYRKKKKANGEKLYEFWLNEEEEQFVREYVEMLKENRDID